MAQARMPFAGRLRFLWMLSGLVLQQTPCGALSGDSEDFLRSSCPNGEYSLWVGRRFGFLHDSSPEFFGGEPLFDGLSMLEIGGPTPYTNIYDVVGRVDNVMNRNLVEYFSQFSGGRANEEVTVPKQNDASVEGVPFAPHGNVKGTMYQRHGAELTGFLNESYGIVFASHSLEHFLDPLRALREWDRVLEPEGYLVLVLPHANNCSDRHRQPATMQELLHIRQAAAQGTAALGRVKRHYYELFVRLFHDYGDDFDPWGLNEEPDLDSRRTIIRAATSTCAAHSPSSDDDEDSSSEQDESCEVDEDLVHWHAWDFDLILEATQGCLGYTPLVLQLQPPQSGVCPYHQLLVAQKPPAKAQRPSSSNNNNNNNDRNAT